MMANAATKILSHALMLTAVFIESPYDAPLRARTSARADPLLTAHRRRSLGRQESGIDYNVVSQSLVLYGSGGCHEALDDDSANTGYKRGNTLWASEVAEDAQGRDWAQVRNVSKKADVDAMVKAALA